MKIIDNDYGFSTFSTAEYEDIIRTKSEQPVNDYKRRLTELEDMVLPFLEKLRDTGDKEYIFWPNRKPVIDKQIEKIKKLTRG